MATVQYIINANNFYSDNQLTVKAGDTIYIGGTDSTYGIASKYANSSSDVNVPGCTLTRVNSGVYKLEGIAIEPGTHKLVKAQRFVAGGTVTLIIEPKLKIKVNDTYTPVKKVWVKKDGTWVQGKSVQVNKEGVWK